MSLLILASFINLYLSSQLHAATLTNTLANNPSQYLAMHAKDPVYWREWNPQTLALAKQLNRPIFVSSGYFACHWCHVMQQENYQNQQTAALLNEHFIAVKIDRELNPELDNRFVEFSKNTTGQGGWPQHVLLTAEGLPFSAFIYLPNAELNLYLQRSVNLWQNQAQLINQLAQQHLSQNSNKLVNTDKLNFNQLALRKQFIETLHQQIDEFSGGLKGTNKFPKAPLLNATIQLLQQSNLNQAELQTLKEWLITTLDMMQNEHLQDHIHGGFYRYTVDPEWQIPHFEKMAYNSALLAQTYLLAAKQFQRDDYLQTALNTLHYLETYLYNPKTQLFQSSHSAIDRHGVEGADYLFNHTQLKTLLNREEFNLVAQAWQLERSAPYPQGWHPKPVDHPLWPQIRNKLSLRALHIPKDTKSVISWNGLILSALALAQQTTASTPQQRKLSQQLANQLANILLQKQAPRAISANGQALGQANLEDYAFVLQALKDYQASLSQHSQKQQQKQQLQQQIHKLEGLTIANFYRQNKWHFEAQASIPALANTSFHKDGSLPSPLAKIVCLQPQTLEHYYAEFLHNPVEHASFMLEDFSQNCKY